MPEATPTPAYPLFLTLTDCHCLVAGLGEVGQRKLAGLLICKPRSVLALDILPREELPPAAQALLSDSCVRYVCRPCRMDDVAASNLVFAATGNHEENLRIAALCQKRRVLCNCASAPHAGNFSLPAVARLGGMAAALSTGGASPALARRWRHELEDWLAPRSRMVRLMGHLRPLVLAMRADTGQNTELFRQIAASPLQGWLANNDMEQCRQWLLAHLPAPLHAHLAELLDDES